MKRQETFNKHCIITTRCVWADLDGSLNLHLCASNVELVVPKESIVAFAKCVEQQLVREVESKEEQFEQVKSSPSVSQLKKKMTLNQ